MPKRANTNGQSSNGGTSSGEGNRKLRRVAAAPTNSGNFINSSISPATAASQPTTSPAIGNPQPTTSSAVAVPVRNDRSFAVPIKTGFNRKWPKLPSQCDIIVVGQCPPTILPQNAYHFANFEARLPWADSTEAFNGQKHGTLTLNMDYPGIPSKKYESHQAPTVSKKATGKKWHVQAIYKDQNNKWNISFEGWSPDSIETYDQSEVDAAYIERFQLRETFLEAYRTLTGPRSAQQIENWLHLCQEYLDDVHHTFWIYQDLTYFHSKIEQQHPYSDASVHYFCLSEPMVSPPTYMYSSMSILEANVVSYLQGKLSNKTFAELDILGLKKPKYSVQRICENWKECKCDVRFSMLYKNVGHKTKNVRFHQDGTIDVNSFTTDKDRVIVECSDECGCSMNCPRRPMQKGQQKSVAVFYEGGHMGFGVRAMEEIKKGEFIMEYTGLLFDTETKDDDFLDTKDATYEATCTVTDPKRIVIDAELIGNAARFINHRCTPNACFIDTESRQNQKDLLIPRIAIYALEDVKIGESLFLRYWAEEEGGEGIECDCKTADCIKILPIRKT